jgi:hypothetical protein
LILDASQRFSAYRQIDVMGRRWLLALAALATLGVGHLSIGVQTAQADQGCSASWTDLGTDPGLDTAWFNVFGDSFDPSVMPVLTFDVPVVPYPLDGSDTVLPAVTSFTMPAEFVDPGGYFKMTFRASDPDTTRLTVTMTAKAIRGDACTASTVVHPNEYAPPQPPECFGDYVLLGKGDGSAEAPFVPTIWFNVFDDIGFRIDSDVVLTFDVAVIPYPPPATPDQVLPAVKTFTMAPDSKETFRTRDKGVKTVTVRMATVSPGCSTTMVVNLDPNAPATPFPTLPDTAAQPSPSSTDASMPFVPVVLMVAVAAGLVLSRRFFRPV